MTAPATAPGLAPDKLRRLLEVTRQLGAPFDVDDMLHQVVDAAKDLLDAEGGSVWQYHPGPAELELRVARGLDPLRIPADRGLVGECLRTRQSINVPDCHSDPRFNPDIDRATGRRTRCMLTLPLVGTGDALVGVLQVLNRRTGVFDDDDEALASALAAQCAVALQRAQLTEQLLAAEKLRREIAVAREVQRGTLPKSAPVVPGYELAGVFQPADETGGDTYDFVPADDGSVLLLMGDATGHGIGPALSATQLRAMLRIARRLGAGLDETFRHLNDQLVVDLPEDRFVTAFLGQLDPASHRLRYHSGGQGPLLHVRAADGHCDFRAPTTFPLGAMPLSTLRPASEFQLAPGDVIALLSDGVYEYHDAAGGQFGEERVADLLRRHAGEPLAVQLARLQEALAAFAGGAPQLDDITMVLLRRLPLVAGPGQARRFARRIDQLDAVFAFLRAGLDAAGADATERYAIEFGVEELFTNMVKYNPGGSGDIEVGLACSGTEIDCWLADPDSDRFDVTAAPDVDVHAPVEQRQPGGLGLHLIRRLVDSIAYDYSGRRSLITFRKRRGSA